MNAWEELFLKFTTVWKNKQRPSKKTIFNIPKTYQLKSAGGNYYNTCVDLCDHQLWL